MNRAKMPLTSTLASDVTHYMILCIHNGMEFFVERPLEDSCSREATIKEVQKLLEPGVTVAKVFAFNPVEHCADDVTEDIAIDIANSLDAAHPIPERIHDFVAHNAGLSMAMKFRVEDRSFWAA